MLVPGLYIYHCAVGTPSLLPPPLSDSSSLLPGPVGVHEANGMFGLILVEPKEGLPPVDQVPLLYLLSSTSSFSPLRFPSPFSSLPPLLRSTMWSNTSCTPPIPLLTPSLVSLTLTSRRAWTRTLRLSSSTVRLARLRYC